MKISCIFVGKTKDSWLQEGEKEFLKRLQRFADVTIKIVNETVKGDTQKILKEEGESILKQIQKDEYVCLLDVQGKKLSSEKLAEHMDSWKSEGKKICFIIGGAFGFSDEVKNRADFRLSFSDMTFTHQMIRVMLLEQIYRAFSIIGGTQYHK